MSRTFVYGLSAISLLFAEPARAAGAAADGSMVALLAAAGFAAAAGLAGWAFSLSGRLGQALEEMRRHRLDGARTGETLSALLLGHSDGAMIWDGDRLISAVGAAAPALSAIGGAAGDAAFERAASTIANAQDAPALTEAFARLSRSGTPFETAIGVPDGRTRRVSGQVVGSRTVIRIADETGSQETLRRTTARASETEEALRERERALDTAPLPIWRRDGSGHLTWVNESYARAVDAENAAMAIDRQIELLGPEGIPLARRALAEQADQRERRPVIIGGDRHTMDVIESPAGAGTFGMAIDVTEAMESRAALRRHLQAHDETLNLFSVGVLSFGPDLRLTFHNSAAPSVLGLEEALLESRPDLSEVLDALHQRRRLPEQSDYREWRRQQIKDFSALQERDADQWHLADGSSMSVICQPHPLGGLLFLFEDVTAQYSLQSRYRTADAVQRAAFSRLQEGVAVFDADGTMRLDNSAFASMWNLARVNLDQRPHITEIARQCAPLFDDERIWNQIIGQVAGSGDSRRAWRSAMTRSDGSMLEMSCTPLPDGATMLSFLDVTTSFRKQADLRDRTEALEKAAALKTRFFEFIHNTSYEVNTPLNTILGFSEIMAQEMYGPLNARQRECIDAVSVASHELRSLLNDIIDLARLQADEMAFREGDVGIYAMLTNIVTFIGSHARERGAGLALHCDPAIGAVRADRSRLKNVIYNIVSALLRNSRAGDTIEIGAERTNGSIRIWARSTGRGLPPDLLRVLKGDAEGAGAATVEIGGPQLSLTLVRGIMRRLGGKIEIDDPEGAKVTFVLPAA